MNYSTRCVTRILTSALAVAICLLLGGCESTPGRPAGPTQTPAASEPASVAELLQKAQSAIPTKAASLYLAAAWSLFNQGDLQQAQTTRDLIDGKLLTGTDRSSYQLLSAELAIARGDEQAAERWLAALETTDEQTPRSSARACAAQGNFICAANELIQGAGENTAENNLIWRYMGLAPGLAVAAQAQRPQAEQRGWWQLKQATLQSQSLAETAKAVQFWRQAWPQHPASRALPTALQRMLESTWQPPKHIGVVLPLTGPLARAGQAVRDGFVVAYLHADNQDGLLVSFYDSESVPMAQLYEQLLLDNVDLLVGPLRKERVVELNALAPELPVLALNYLDPGSAANAQISQLGLAIEDEAATMIRELAALEVESLLVFHNYEDWSLRARHQITENWNGRITVQPFTDIRTITEAVGTAMEVDQSLQRETELTELLAEEIEFLPRARQDIDAVVALIDNVEANALVPALQFHFADQLPIYASSQVVRGARVDQLQELQGFRVSELPFFLDNDPLFVEMEKPFSLAGNRFSSLYALGIDAFRISLMLGALERNNTSIMIGSTGVLSLASDGRFHRELDWSVIKSGRLQPRSAAEIHHTTGD